MKRLTERMNDALDGVWVKDHDYIAAVRRLAAYEDTGLEPEECGNLAYKLVGVMHFVDKWLKGEELKQDEVNRAATMREKVLRLIENLEAEAVLLAAYKDTGLTPEAYKRYAEAIRKLDIAHMHDLLQAEKDGRLVVLPVPVGKGQKVYGIFDAEPIPVHIQEIDCDHFDRLEIYPSGEVVVEVDGWEIGQSDIAKTVFLTREAAEKALLQKDEDQKNEEQRLYLRH